MNLEVVNGYLLSYLLWLCLRHCAQMTLRNLSWKSISNAGFQVDVCIMEQMMPSARVVPPPYIRVIWNFRQSQTIIIKGCMKVNVV